MRDPRSFALSLAKINLDICVFRGKKVRVCENFTDFPFDSYDFENGKLITECEICENLVFVQQMCVKIRFPT